MRTTLELGKLQTSLAAGEKLQELVKMQQGMKEEPDSRKRNQWSPRAMPRVSIFVFHIRRA
jgi:hypothetical protein